MTEQEELKPKKFQKLLKILKISALVLLVLIVLIAGYFAYCLSQKDLFGWRFNITLNKVKTKQYSSFAPTIAFLYPETFELDLDPEKKKYGKSYLVGMKLKTDDRTGCDIRLGGPELDFSKSTDELAQAIAGPIQEKASDFRLIKKEKTAIGGQEAFKISFSFLDPIGARIRLDQTFTKGKDGERYMMICGAGEYQFSFFQKDFSIFYDSINFDGKISDFEINQPWYRTLWNELIFWRK